MTDRIATIIAPVDGSRPSLLAARYAGQLALFLGAGLKLLYVMPPGPAELMDWPANRDKDTDANLGARRQQANEILSAARAALDEAVLAKASGVVVDDIAHHGDPATVIDEVANSTPDCMLVMGARGRGGLRRLLMGSVSEATVQGADCPVTVVHDRDHPSNQPGLEVIVLPVDGSAHSDAAARLAGELARGSHAEVHLLFAYPHHPAEVGGVGTAIGDYGAISESMLKSFQEAGREEARRVFDRARAQLGEVPGAVLERQLESGDPAAAITAYVQQQTRPTSVIMGRRGMGPWQERLLGSVSSTVMDRAPCPVTLVH